MKMAPIARAYDSVHWYMNEIGARVVAKTGIPSDRFHLGKLILQGMRDSPDFVLQIDGATGECETNRSVLERTIRCAISMKNLGLKRGDVMVVTGPNHIDMTVPIYAALSLGIIVAPLDPTLGVKEFEPMFFNLEPKIIFCQSEKTSTVQQALVNTHLDATIINFDKESDYISLTEFISTDGDVCAIQNFEAADFDPETNVAYLTTTSGTTGLPKAAALSHKNLTISLPYAWINCNTFATPTKMALVVSPVQWLSAGIHYLFAPILRYTRLQSSQSLTSEMIIPLINKYRPTFIIISPTLMATLVNSGYREKCDLTSFDTILIGGSAVAEELVNEVKTLTPRTKVTAFYGMSEIGGISFQDGSQKHGSVGRPMGSFDYRLVDPVTREDIDVPNVNGELWLKGPAVFMGYYRNPQTTAETLVEDGWIRTGDLLYRDEEDHFYFVERLKLLLKYMSHQISPTEVELVIRQHPGVMDVAVTGVPDPERGDLVVACVVRRPGFNVTAQEIKDLVKENLTDSKQLRGGVVFMDELPTTATTKVDRRRLKDIVLRMVRE